MDIEEAKRKKYEDIKDQRWGCNKINPRFCKSCIFSSGENPFENSPKKAYCMVYTKAEGKGKPSAVYYDGEKCDYYKKNAE